MRITALPGGFFLLSAIGFTYKGAKKQQKNG